MRRLILILIVLFIGCSSTPDIVIPPLPPPTIIVPPKPNEIRKVTKEDIAIQQSYVTYLSVLCNDKDDFDACRKLPEEVKKLKAYLGR
jgi:hypothetical protein